LIGFSFITTHIGLAVIHIRIGSAGMMKKTVFAHHFFRLSAA